MSAERTFTVHVCTEPECGRYATGAGDCWNALKHRGEGTARMVPVTAVPAERAEEAERLLAALLAAVEKQQHYTRMAVEGPLNTQLRDLYLLANETRAAVGSSEQAPTREGGDADDARREAPRGIDSPRADVAEAASGGPSGAASLNSHPACALFGHDYWDEPGAGAA